MHLLIIQHMSVNPFGADPGGLQQPEFLARPVSLERLLPNRFAPSCSQHLGFSWRVIFGGRSLKRQVPFCGLFLGLEERSCARFVAEGSSAGATAVKQQGRSKSTNHAWKHREALPEIPQGRALLVAAPLLLGDSFAPARSVPPISGAQRGCAGGFGSTRLLKDQGTVADLQIRVKNLPPAPWHAKFSRHL